MKRAPLQGQRGVALIVVLVLTLVLALLAMAGLRASMFTTGLAANSRQQALALEAAEAAVRYCESQAMLVVPGVMIHELPEEGGTTPARWEQAATWASGGLATPVPPLWLRGLNSEQQYGVMPECLVERVRLPNLPGSAPADNFLVTARGFSPDAVVSSSGALQEGAEVWLQSIVQR